MIMATRIALLCSLLLVITSTTNANNETTSSVCHSSSFVDRSDLPSDVILDHILAGDYVSLDSTLAQSVAQLRSRGAHKCWHKHSTFLDHLLGVHNLLR